MFRTWDEWQNEVFRKKEESIGLVNKVNINFLCFKKWLHQESDLR